MHDNLSPRTKKSRQLQRQSRGKENWGSTINLNGIYEALLERSGVAHRQRESFLSEPALELEAKRLTSRTKYDDDDVVVVVVVWGG